MNLDYLPQQSKVTVLDCIPIELIETLIIPHLSWEDCCSLLQSCRYLYSMRGRKYILDYLNTNLEKSIMDDMNKSFDDKLKYDIDDFQQLLYLFKSRMGISKKRKKIGKILLSDKTVDRIVERTKNGNKDHINNGYKYIPLEMIYKNTSNKFTKKDKLPSDLKEKYDKMDQVYAKNGYTYQAAELVDTSDYYFHFMTSVRLKNKISFRRIDVPITRCSCGKPHYQYFLEYEGKRYSLTKHDSMGKVDSHERKVLREL